MKESTGKFVRISWYVDNSFLDFKDIVMYPYPRTEVFMPFTWISLNRNWYHVIPNITRLHGVSPEDNNPIHFNVVLVLNFGRDILKIEDT